MTVSAKPLRRFWATVGIGWLVLGLAAIVYARIMKVPAAIALPVALAFLAEYPFYLLPGFSGARERLLSYGKPLGAAILAVSSLVPWLIYAVPTGHFNSPALIVIVSIALLMNFWYVAFPANPAADLLYLSLFGAILLLKVFTRVYPAPWPKIEASALGHVMLIRVMAFSFVGIRGGVEADYRFIPSRREWMTGLRWFALLLPITGAVYWALGLVILRPHPLNIGVVIATFVGFFLVVAISEEFIFRGLLQPWIEKWTNSPNLALAITTLLFGSVHLSFRFHNVFPNWRFSIAAATLGLFCGLARRQTGGIQAGMVAHALTVAVWRMFLV